MGERIKKVRKILELTQQEFGKRIGIKPNSVSLIESGQRNTSEQVILSICREFNVNEKWLRSGEGEMFPQESEEDELKRVVDNFLKGSHTKFKQRLISVLSILDDEDWIELEKRLKKIVGVQDEPKHSNLTLEQQARIEAEQYYQEILEEKKAEAESAALRNTESNSKMA